MCLISLKCQFPGSTVQAQVAETHIDSRWACQEAPSICTCSEVARSPRRHLRGKIGKHITGSARAGWLRLILPRAIPNAPPREVGDQSSTAGGLQPPSESSIRGRLRHFQRQPTGPTQTTLSSLSSAMGGGRVSCLSRGKRRVSVRGESGVRTSGNAPCQRARSHTPEPRPDACTDLDMPSAVPGSAVNAYNNEPGSGRTGFFEIPPNNYDWYSEDEKYKPNVQADGGILSSAQSCLPGSLWPRNCIRLGSCELSLGCLRLHA